MHVNIKVFHLMDGILEKLIILWLHTRDRIPVGTRFSAHPDRTWGPPSLL